MLNSNPISNENYKNSVKTLFIINSSTPQSLMNLFNQQSYTDNYILFGDPFFNTKLNTNILWSYSLILMGNYSQMGYKYSKFVDATQNISPMTLGLVDVLVHFSNIYKNKYNLSIPDLLIFLKNIELIKCSELNKRTSWFIEYEMIYHIFNTELIKNFDYELLAFENEYNPKLTGGVSIDDKPSFREYQTNLLIKIGEFISLCRDLKNELLIFFYKTRKATTLDELYTINDEVDILVENC